MRERTKKLKGKNVKNISGEVKCFLGWAVKNSTTQKVSLAIKKKKKKTYIHKTKPCMTTSFVNLLND